MFPLPLQILNWNLQQKIVYLVENVQYVNILNRDVIVRIPHRKIPETSVSNLIRTSRERQTYVLGESGLVG